MTLTLFTTWTTYGTWLPGDERGWFKRGEGAKAPDAKRSAEVRAGMSHDAVTLDPDQRSLIEATIVTHCGYRGWSLLAVSCRTNHVHVVVGVPIDCHIATPREQLKVWCSRKLNENARRAKWWTERGWDVCIDREDDLIAAIDYVQNRQ